MCHRHITQCQSGAVEWDATKPDFIFSGRYHQRYDSTPNVLSLSLMFLLGHGLNQAEICHRMNSDLAGEITQTISGGSTANVKPPLYGCFQIRYMK